VTARLGTVRELDVLLLLIDELHVSRRSAPDRLRESASPSRSSATTRGSGCSTNAGGRVASHGSQARPARG
jgi:hypothetical protein